MIELTDIAYVRSGAADLAGAVDFATRIVGLELVDGGEPGVAHLRADGRHHCLALVGGESGVIATAFTVADEDALALAETELEQRGFTVTRGDATESRSRRVRQFIGLDDPFGNRIELVVDQQSLGRPVAFSRRAGITEFGHVCLDAPDVREAYRFWSTTFNAKVSDWIGDGACLMRIDPVHHKLAVFKNDEPGLCHINFQVAEIDDVFRNWHFLLDNGVEIEMGPGRHPQSTAVFLYFLGPEGFTYEYSFGVRRIEDDAAWRPRMFDPEEPGSIDMWLGPKARTVSQPQLGRRLRSPRRKPGRGAAPSTTMLTLRRSRRPRGACSSGVAVLGGRRGRRPRTDRPARRRHLAQPAVRCRSSRRGHDDGAMTHLDAASSRSPTRTAATGPQGPRHQASVDYVAGVLRARVRHGHPDLQVRTATGRRPTRNVIAQTRTGDPAAW